MKLLPFAVLLMAATCMAQTFTIKSDNLAVWAPPKPSISFDSKEMKAEEIAELESARAAVSAAQVKLNEVEGKVKASYGQSGSLCSVNGLCLTICRYGFTDVELRGRFALITTRITGNCQ